MHVDAPLERPPAAEQPVDHLGADVRCEGPSTAAKSGVRRHGAGSVALAHRQRLDTDRDHERVAVIDLGVGPGKRMRAPPRPGAGEFCG